MDPGEKFLKDVVSSRKEAIRDATAAGDSDVQRFYCGRTAFLTGGSGFLGKQLIEKLLRTCKVSKVYILLRPKKGKTVQQRCSELMEESVYGLLRDQQPDFSRKIVPIEGDVSEIRLGIKDEDWNILSKEVDIIFHVAATTRFDEKIKVATKINVRGTRECLKLGRACNNLCSYVHFSTAYTHTTHSKSEDSVLEAFYDSPLTPDALISMAETMDDERLANITPNLIKDWPNTYSFTKALSEELIRTTTDGLPICIIRPGIVISSSYEPYPGWIDMSAVYSATGILTGIGLGIIHTVPVDVNVNLGLIPCDYVNNTAIVAGRETALTQNKGGDHTKIYTVSPTARNPITWGKIGEYVRNECYKFSSPLAVYYPYLIETNNKILYAILSLLLHLIPAFIVDTICLLIGKERRLVKTAKKVYTMSNALSYFMTNKWVLVDDNTAALYENLSEQDKVLFNFKVTDINWKEYIVTWCLGIRKHIIKDGLKDTEYALRKQKVLEMDPAMRIEVSALAHQQAIRDATAAGDSDVQRFYCGRTAFLTGGSGFLGKQLIEKLIRSCKISKVYMLLRSKRGKTIQQRFDDFITDTVFSVLRDQQPDFSSKIVPIEGDVSEIRLGINDEDWNTLTNEVDVIFHVAATTRFYESLRVATLINVRGTGECLKLGKACLKLCSFVHVSTAYTHTKMTNAGQDVDEKFYRCPVPPEALISMAEDMEEDRINNITHTLIKDWPNTYTFTKAISEELVRKTSAGLPICIVRPGIVLASSYEPSPGWLDTSAMYGASGVIAGAGIGIIHTALVDIDVKLGIIPCDYVNNTTIVAGRETALTKNKGGDHTKIYAVTSTCRNPITWYGLAKLVRDEGSKSPTPSAIYYNYMIETKYKLLFKILTLILHVIPALLVDTVCFVLGKERRFLKLAKKVYHLSDALTFFWNHQWTIVDKNTESLYENLSKQDKIIFNFNIKDIDWKEYITIWCLGIRKYIIKDGLKNTDYALKKQKIFAFAHYIIAPLYAYVLLKIVYFVFSSVIGMVL